MAANDVKLMPVQSNPRNREAANLNAVVVLRAYEVYCELYGAQPAMVTGWCRGGFSSGEIIAYLYARSFPKTEWRVRTDEAFRGMNV
jgi:hypothetical protein